MQPIPYGRHEITNEDITAVVEVLRSDFLTQGPKILEFEKAFASYIGSKFAIAVSNGTAALHLCALALQVGKGDKIITTPITFAASANCVHYCGGEVVFADIDPNTYLLDINKVKELLENSPKGTYKGIIAVDFAGSPVNLEEFRKLADQYNLWILEDACHAPGAYFIDSRGQKQFCGNGALAELTVFSFHPVKHIATGEGGMITTNDKALYEKLLLLRTHGITKNREVFNNSLDLAIGHESENEQDYPGWYYEMLDLGFNYRMTEFQAALGLSQLKRAEPGLMRRKEIARRYQEAFSGEKFIKSNSEFFEGHAYHLYVIEVEERKRLYDHLHKNDILAQVHYIPVHLMPYYRRFGWENGDLPVSEKYYGDCLSLPMYPSLNAEEQEFIIHTVLSFFQQNAF